MAVVTVTAQNTRLDDAEATTQWGSIGGGPGGALETDFKYQASNCFARKGASALRGIFMSDDVDSDLSGAGTYETVMFKFICTTPGLLDLLSVPGMRLEIGSGSVPAAASVDFHFYDVQGSDTYPIDKSWLVLPINPNIALHRTGTTGSPDLTLADYYALRYDQTGVSKSPNQAMDAVDIGAGLTLAGGDGADPDGVWQDFSDADWGTVANRYGYVREVDGATAVFLIFGRMVIGTAAATVFNDTGSTLIFPDGLFASGFSGITVDLQNAATDVDFKDSNFFGKGTQSGEDTRPDLVATSTSGAFDSDGCVFDVLRRIKLNSACTFATTTISNSGQIDPTNADYGGFTTNSSTGYLDTQENMNLASASGDFELIMRVRAADWTPAAIDALASHYGGSIATESFRLQLLTTGGFRLIVSDGAAETTLDSSLPLPAFVDSTWHWVRVFYDQSVGVAAFFHSSDPEDTPIGDIAWTALGTPIGTSRSIPSLTRPFLVYAENDVTPTSFLTGDISFVELWIDGFRATGASHGDLIFRGDWRTGPNFSGSPLTRADDFDGTSFTWEIHTGASYTTADNNSGAVTLAGCTVANSSSESALLWNVNTDPLGELDDMKFVSVGVGHALELGPNTPASISLSNHSYTGYAGVDGSTGNEVIYNNSKKAITISIADDGDTPTIRNGTGASTTVINTKTLTLTVKDKDGNVIQGVRCLIAATAGGPEAIGTQLLLEETNVSGVATEPYGFSSNQPVQVDARLKGFLPFLATGTITTAGFTLDITLQNDPNVE